MHKLANRLGFLLMWVCGIGVSLLVVYIVTFLFLNAQSFFSEYSVWSFVFGREWRPSAGKYGLLPMLFGSAVTASLALIMALPTGVFAVLALKYYCGKHLRKGIELVVNTMAGIPSVVYGLFGLIILCPMFRSLFGGTGFSSLTAAVLLAVMILPTIMALYYSEVDSIPPAYFANALALGESKEKSIFKCIVPKSSYGIISAGILAIGRAVGETMAVLMVAGNVAKTDWSLLKGIRTLTTNIAMEMGYASGEHRNALVASGFLLLIIILLLELILYVLKRKYANE